MLRAVAVLLLLLPAVVHAAPPASAWANIAGKTVSGHFGGSAQVRTRSRIWQARGSKGEFSNHRLMTLERQGDELSVYLPNTFSSGGQTVTGRIVASELIPGRGASRLKVRFSGKKAADLAFLDARNTGFLSTSLSPWLTGGDVEATLLFDRTGGLKLESVGRFSHDSLTFFAGAKITNAARSAVLPKIITERVSARMRPVSDEQMAELAAMRK